jgi:hypothetical protein
MKKDGACAFGDHCPYAHNVFEYWLHPTRYRTQLCNDGAACRRKICFFAHSLEELRAPEVKPFVSPEALAAAAAAAAGDAPAGSAAAAAAGRRRGSVDRVPTANLGMPPRLSADSVRQSTDWGPAALPAAQRLSGDSASAPGSGSLQGGDQAAAALGGGALGAALGGGAPAALGAAPPLGASEQRVVDTVTSMLAQDRITPPQAAAILQQLLPPAAMAALHARLGAEAAAAAGFAPAPPAEPAAAPMLPSRASPFFESLDSGRYSDPGPRPSMESARSSFEAVRMSLELPGTPARASLESPRAGAPGGAGAPAYGTPPAAYPQFWAAQHALSPVPEGAALPAAAPALPPGGWARRPDESAAARLGAPCGVGIWGGAAPATNPYASSLFGCAAAAGADAAAAMSAASWAAAAREAEREAAQQ